VLLASAPGLAQTDDEAARKHFESGTEYLARSDYDNALREFKAAYELSKRPELLLNIATVYERMGRTQDAVDALTLLLSENPNHPQHATIQQRIDNLKKRLSEAPDAGAVSQDAAPSEAPAPIQTAPPPPAPAPKPAPESGPNRVPAFIVLGIGGAAAIGAVTFGVMAKTKFDDAKADCKPNCDNNTVDKIERFALVSDILSGVAVLGVGIGTVLLLTAGSSEEKPTGAVPALRLGVARRGAGAEATWRF
jgi:tetratricopeptide (TPR) repeat protein